MGLWIIPNQARESNLFDLAKIEKREQKPNSTPQFFLQNFDLIY